MRKEFKTLAATLVAALPLVGCEQHPTAQALQFERNADQAKACITPFAGLVKPSKDTSYGDVQVLRDATGTLVVLNGDSLRPLVSSDNPSKVPVNIISRTYVYQSSGDYVLTEIPDSKSSEPQKVIPSNYMNGAVRREGDEFGRCLKQAGLLTSGGPTG